MVTAEQKAVGAAKYGARGGGNFALLPPPSFPRVGSGREEQRAQVAVAAAFRKERG